MSERFFHITSPEAWQAGVSAGAYEDPSLTSEGFIHGSFLGQILRSANKHFAGRRGLLCIEIDPARLTSELVVEDSYGSGMEFPHVYGPINPDAVVRTHTLVDQPDGTFALPEALS